MQFCVYNSSLIYSVIQARSNLYCVLDSNRWRFISRYTVIQAVLSAGGEHALKIIQNYI